MNANECARRYSQIDRGGVAGAVPPHSYGYDRRRFGRVRVLTMTNSKTAAKYRFGRWRALAVADKLPQSQPFRLRGRRNRCLVSRISHIFGSFWIWAIATSPRS